MIITEILLYAVIAFGGGVYLGNIAAKPTTQQSADIPEKWTPESHQEMIRACSLSCADGKFKSYDAIRSKCECSS